MGDTVLLKMTSVIASIAYWCLCVLQTRYAAGSCRRTSSTYFLFTTKIMVRVHPSKALQIRSLRTMGFPTFARVKYGCSHSPASLDMYLTPSVFGSSQMKIRRFALSWRKSIIRPADGIFTSVTTTISRRLKTMKKFGQRKYSMSPRFKKSPGTMISNFNSVTPGLVPGLTTGTANKAFTQP